MLADQTDFVIGVDTHRDRHALAILAAEAAACSTQPSAATDAAATRRLWRWARRRRDGRRVWAIEGSGSYGAGLARFLAERGERVVEIGRRVAAAARAAPRATRSTRSSEHASVSAEPRQAAPRACGEREALRR